MKPRNKEGLWLLVWACMVFTVVSFVDVDSVVSYHSPQERSAHLSMLGPFGLFSNGGGSAAYYKDGWLVTAAHVGNCGESAIVTCNDGTKESSSKILISDKYDVAFIKVGKKLSNVHIKNRKQTKVTKEVICISCPQYWRHVKTKGYIFHKHTKYAGGPEYLTAYLDIQLGSSGGGVYQDGKMVGIVSALILPQFHAVTMVVPVDLIEEEFNRLVKGETNDN